MNYNFVRMVRRGLPFDLVFLFVFTAASSVSAQSVSVEFQDGIGGYTGTRDTRLQVNPSKRNFGADDQLDVDGRPDKSVLLYWDVSSIPAGSIVESVDVVVNVTTGSNSGFAMYELLRGWVEREATWEEFASGQDWQTAGAEGPDDRASTAVGTLIAPQTGRQTTSLNMPGIQLVQAWVDNPASNHGLIVSDYDSNSSLQFSSREAANPVERPKLIVTYDAGNLPSISIDDVVVSEGDAGAVEATFTVSLSEAADETVTVEYTAMDGTATSNEDYVSSSGQVLFPAGETTQTVAINVNGDVLHEFDETFLIELSNAVNAVLSDNQGAGTITDDDPAPDLSIADASADESAGSIIFTVTPSAISGREISVDYVTADGTATAPADYGATSGTLMLPAGSASGTIIVSLADDAFDESVEVFTVELSNSNGATITDSQGQGTIDDDDAPPVVSIADTSASEGAGTMTFRVSLSAVSGKDVTVDYTTLDGTAAAPDDYAAASGTLTISAGSSSGAIAVALNDDAETESPETFTVELSDAVDATLDIAQGEGTILDNEGLPSLFIDDVVVTEGDMGETEASFTVTLSVASAQSVTVDFTTSDGTAVAGEDYIASAGQIVFAPGETGKSVGVSVLGDALDEADETFTIELINAVDADISDGLGQGTITDDDEIPSISISDLSVDEAIGTMSFTVTLSAISGRDVSVDYETMDGSAVAPADYIATSGTLSIPAGSGAATITFGNIGDFGDGSLAEKNVADMLLALNPDFITTNGDNNYPDGEIATWAENVLQFYGSYVDSVDVQANRFYAALGNHDYHVFPAAFLNGLALPPGQGNERYYDYVKGPVHFFALDSNSEQPDGRSSTSVQGQWLQQKLAESTSIWNIVYFHHTPWSSGQNHGNNSTLQWPFDAWGVDAVLAGHDHTYERISKDEDGDGEPILYFVNGIGGNGIYQFGSPIAGSEFRYNDDHGAMFIRANADSIAYEFHAVSEGLVDRFVVYRTSDPVVSLTIDATVIDDSDVEIDETYTLNLSNPVNAAITDGQATGTIEDNDGLSIVASFQEGTDGYSGAQDTKLLESQANGNYGGANSLEIDGSPLKSTLLRWDISSIPPGSDVESVEITVDVSDRSGDTYELYEVLRPWVEAEATWNDFAQGLSWEAGGANGTLDRGTALLGGITAPSVGVTTIGLNEDGVDAVQSWVNDPASNHGIIIMDYLAASNGLDFPSREANPASSRPRLTVTYTNNGPAASKSAPAMLEPRLDAESLPDEITLRSNYPNPFNRETRIEYTLPGQAQISLVVYNVMGQKVRVLAEGIRQSGVGVAVWDGRDEAHRELGSGVYFLRLVVDRQSYVRKMVLKR